MVHVPMGFAGEIPIFLWVLLVNSSRFPVLPRVHRGRTESPGTAVFSTWLSEVRSGAQRAGWEDDIQMKSE